MPRTRLLLIAAVALAGITALLMVVRVWRDGDPVVAGLLSAFWAVVLVWFAARIVRRSTRAR